MSHLSAQLVGIKWGLFTVVLISIFIYIRSLGWFKFSGLINTPLTYNLGLLCW